MLRISNAGVLGVTMSTQESTEGRQMLAARWQVMTARWIETRSLYERLANEPSVDIQALRRAARQLHDLQLERGAVASVLESPVK